MAADTYSPSLGAIEQGTGNNSNNWGNLLNGALTQLDKGVAGAYAVTSTGGTLDFSTPVPPAGPHPRPEAGLHFTGALTSHLIMKVPRVSKGYFVLNGTTGGFSVILRATDGVTDSDTFIPQGGSTTVFFNSVIGVWNQTPSGRIINVQFAGPDGTLTAPGFSFASEQNSGWRRVSAGVIALTIAGVDIVTFTGSSVTLNPAVSFSAVPPGTETEYAGIVTPSGWYLEFGQAVTRAGDVGLFNAITAGVTGSTTNGSAVVTGVSADLRGLGLEGAVMEGTGFQSATLLLSVDSPTQITLTKTVSGNTPTNAIRAFPYGNGDGSTTFNIPDARGTVPIGRDNMGSNSTTGRGLVTIMAAYSLAAIGGSQTVVLDATMIPSHTHGVNDSGHQHDVPGQINVQQGTGVNAIRGDFTVPNGQKTSVNATGITIQNTGGGLAHSNMQPSRIRNVIIKR